MNEDKFDVFPTLLQKSREHAATKKGATGSPLALCFATLLTRFCTRSGVREQEGRAAADGDSRWHRVHTRRAGGPRDCVPTGPQEGAAAHDGGERDRVRVCAHEAARGGERARTAAGGSAAVGRRAAAEPNCGCCDSCRDGSPEVRAEAEYAVAALHALDTRVGELHPRVAAARGAAAAGRTLGRGSCSVDCVLAPPAARPRRPQRAAVRGARTAHVTCVAHSR